MTAHASGPACRAVSEFWDSVVDDFLSGRQIRPCLKPWAESYRGRGAGAVEWDALPESFLGPLTKPQGVFLALNPGQACLRFQGRDGIFADEIRANGGSYSVWAASWPYLRDPWVKEKGRNRHHSTRLRFLRDWIGDKELPGSAMVSFELYPWHSARFNGRRAFEGAKELIVEFVWKPVAELGAPVFAFGADWFPILDPICEKRILGLEVVERLGACGRPYGSKVESRSVMVLRNKDGLTVIAEKHLGAAGPPSPDETYMLRDALGDICR